MNAVAANTDTPAPPATRSTARWMAGPNLLHLLFRPSINNLTLLLATISLSAFLLIIATVVIYEAGGTQTAWPYLALFPVILMAAVFKIPGGLICGLIAGLLLGPYMPLNVDAGIAQSTQNWVVRLVFYLMLGVFAGGISSVLGYMHARSGAAERTDRASGLISPLTVDQFAADGMLAEIAGYTPTHAAVVEFEGYDDVVLAMGPGVGNTIVRRLARAFEDAVAKGLIVTRIGGATFGVVATGDRRDISRLIRRCVNEIPSAMRIDGIQLTILPRFGVTELSDDETSIQAPFRRALVALRQAKRDEKRILYYDATFDENARTNLALLSEFRNDLEQGMCNVHFQPKLDLASGRVVGCEALLRWRNAKRGDVSPGRIMPLVEHTVLNRRVAKFVAERSAMALGEWHRKRLDISVAINITAQNLEDDVLVDFLLKLPGRFAVPARGIELELTETAVLRNYGAARAALERLRGTGMKIAIDDYGTHHSSLAYLKELPIDVVKLDQAFVKEMPNDSKNREICAATATMCKRLGYKILAEGVESRSALNLLRDQGFDQVQGYLVGKPMEFESFQKWLAQHQPKNFGSPSAMAMDWQV